MPGQSEPQARAVLQASTTEVILEGSKGAHTDPRGGIHFPFIYDHPAGQVEAPLFDAPVTI